MEERERGRSIPKLAMLRRTSFAMHTKSPLPVGAACGRPAIACHRPMSTVYSGRKRTARCRALECARTGRSRAIAMAFVGVGWALFSG